MEAFPCMADPDLPARAAHPGGKVLKVPDWISEKAAAAIGGDCASMGHAFQGTDRGLDEPVAGAIIHLCDQSKTATVAFEFRTVQTSGAKLGGHRHSLFLRCYRRHSIPAQMHRHRNSKGFAAAQH